MKLVLARHGETDANRDSRMQGRDGEPLNAAGRAQAEDVANALTTDMPFTLYSSSVMRARQTAQAISNAHGVPFTLVDELAEIEVGALDGLTDREMPRKYPDFVAEWLQDASTARPPGGETVQEVQDRAWRAVQRLSEEHLNETVVAVSHNFTILTVVARALEMPLRHFRRIRLELGALARIDLSSDGPQVVSTNETWHLRSRGKDGFYG